MGLEREGWCPNCEAECTFWRTGSTSLHLGQKVKWACTECEHGVVTIDGVVDTADV